MKIEKKQKFVSPYKSMDGKKERDEDVIIDIVSIMLINSPLFDIEKVTCLI